MRVLLTGGGGQLGRELQRAVPEGVELSALDHSQLDIRDDRGVEQAVAATSPALIINAAAYTAVDRAERESDRAFAVNERGAHQLARAARAHRARLLHLSTDFVFDGGQGRPYLPEDDTAPLNVYGESKRQGEIRVLEATRGEALILRTGWLYSSLGDNFVRTILGLLGGREELPVVCDQIGTPTWARGFARAIWRAAARPELRGILHFSDAGVASWYDFAVAIQEEAVGLGGPGRGSLVRPVSSAERPTPATRPAFSVLDATAAWKTLGWSPVHWRTALRVMLHELLESSGG